MKVMVTGACGQLGYDTVRELRERKIECIGVDIAELDITDKDAVFSFIENYSPDAVIHCAAYTAVDKAEDECEKCCQVNEKASGYIAKSCEEVGAKMIYISTDYVFGSDTEDFIETDSIKNPLSVYGKTKLAGEEAVISNCSRHFVVRTSWVFGKNGNNFVRTMRRLCSDRDEISVVADQIGSPTYTYDLSKLLCDMVLSEKYGVYHATNEGICSWADFTEEIIKLSGYKTVVKRITTEEFGAKAHRPKNSRLSKNCLDEAGFSRLPHWKDALERYIKEIE